MFPSAPFRAAAVAGLLLPAAAGQHRLFSFQGPKGSLFGRAIAPAGDVDRDGQPDVIVGAPGSTRWSSTGAAGYAEVISGADGHVLQRLVPPGRDHHDRFGRDVAGAGDVDRDGYPDLLVGAPGRTWQRTVAPRVYLFGCGSFGTTCGPSSGESL